MPISCNENLVFHKFDANIDYAFFVGAPREAPAFCVRSSALRGRLTSRPYEIQNATPIKLTRAGGVEFTYSMTHNRLSAEKSPYLLQHQHNPIHWYAWSDEAQRAALAQNKIIFLSIGYSSCYWCHMMERDSFELPEVGEALNAHFVSIKVDREEHPDVDQIYMDAVQALTGRGGWPLTVFLTPDLKPFFGGTYFRRDQFLHILAQIQDVWQNEPDRILQSANKITEALKANVPEASSLDFAPADFTAIIEKFGRNFDSFYGGFGTAPKFPQATQLSLLLRLHQRFPDSQALQMAETTLTEMAKGGLYDHVGGGFHRYSTDERWFVPHFEKMLYDNALLVFAYATAFQVTQKNEYAAVIRQTLDFVLREMTDERGGFYAALDAGDVNEEGDYYVWQAQELQSHLSADEWQTLKAVFGFTESGNWEHGKNIVYLPKDQSLADGQRAQDVLQKLATLRQKRVRPRLDNKILTSWSGLMIAALAVGYRTLGDDRYLQAAQQAAKFIAAKMQTAHEATIPDSCLNRRYCGGEAKFLGTMDDYAFLIFGLLELYQTDLDLKWLSWLQSLQGQQDQLFWDSKDGGYFFTAPSQTDMIVRKKDFYDGAQPSGNAVAAHNLVRLHQLTGLEGYLQKAQGTLGHLGHTIKQLPLAATQALLAVDLLLSQPKLVVVILPAQTSLSAEIQKIIFATSAQKAVWLVYHDTDFERLEVAQHKGSIDGKPTFYVCEKQACQAPVTDISSLFLFL